MNPKPVSDLPAPDATSAAHSRNVARHIATRIEASGGSISFAEYMSEALYAPGLGYYSAGSEKFGEAGDFVTAPEISPLFGYVIARQIAPVLQSMGGDVLEPGAGSGELAASILERLATLDALPDRFLILEVSPELKSRQAARLAELPPDISGLVEWVDGLPGDFRGVVVANEVLDALPVERFRVDAGEILQARVVNADDRFGWRFDAAPDALVDAVRLIEQSLGDPFADGFTSEVALAGRQWIEELCGALRQGLVLLFDYGLPQRAYYAIDRTTGWLRCHYRHRAHADPLVLAGIQDITAWVDFTAIAEVGNVAGMDLIGYTTQAGFLLHGGLDLELAQFTEMPVEQQVAMSSKVKQLTLPTEMGENFKCIGLGRGELTALPALHAADMAHQL